MDGRVGKPHRRVAALVPRLGPVLLAPVLLASAALTGVAGVAGCASASPASGGRTSSGIAGVAGVAGGAGSAGTGGRTSSAARAGTGATGSGPGTGAGAGAAGSGTGAQGGQPLPEGRAPSRTFPVGTQTFTLRRPGRVLATSVWYPALAARRNAPAAAGTFPVILFSHGLLGLPTDYAPLLRRWASAGFVVVAPAYPHTSRGASLDVLDVPEQPADASFVLSAVLGGRLLHARVDPRRVAAAGHSAGGITTVGLFTGQRDPRLVAGVVLAGSGLGVGTAFTGPPAWLLFVHGGADPLVPYGSGQEAYRADPWAKEFIGLPGQGHSDPFLAPGTASFRLVAAATTDFWRLALDGDRAAGRRIAADVRAGASLGVPAQVSGTLPTTG